MNDAPGPAPPPAVPSGRYPPAPLAPSDLPTEPIWIGFLREAEQRKNRRLRDLAISGLAVALLAAAAALTIAVATAAPARADGPARFADTVGGPSWARVTSAGGSYLQSTVTSGVPQPGDLAFMLESDTRYYPATGKAYGIQRTFQLDSHGISLVTVNVIGLFDVLRIPLQVQPPGDRVGSTWSHTSPLTDNGADLGALTVSGTLTAVDRTGCVTSDLTYAYRWAGGTAAADLLTGIIGDERTTTTRCPGRWTTSEPVTGGTTETLTAESFNAQVPAAGLEPVRAPTTPHASGGWAIQASSATALIPVSDLVVGAGASDRTVSAEGGPSQQLQWQVILPRALYVTPAAITWTGPTGAARSGSAPPAPGGPDTVVTVDSIGGVWWLDARTGLIRAHRDDGPDHPVGAVAVGTDKVLLTGLDGTLTWATATGTLAPAGTMTGPIRAAWAAGDGPTGVPPPAPAPAPGAVVITAAGQLWSVVADGRQALLADTAAATNGSYSRWDAVTSVGGVDSTFTVFDGDSTPRSAAGPLLENDILVATAPTGDVLAWSPTGRDAAIRRRDGTAAPIPTVVLGAAPAARGGWWVITAAGFGASLINLRPDGTTAASFPVPLPPDSPTALLWAPPLEVAGTVWLASGDGVTAIDVGTA